MRDRASGHPRITLRSIRATFKNILNLEPLAYYSPLNSNAIL